MNARLRLSEGGVGGPDATAQSGDRDRDAIAVWLDTLGVLLRMPGAKSTAIRDELEGHLRERVRDLLLNGTSEPEAVRTAIGELGDAVKLAERLRAAGQGPRRRHIMASVAIFGVAGAALVTSLVALQGSTGGGGSGEPGAGTAGNEQPAQLAEGWKLERGTAQPQGVAGRELPSYAVEFSYTVNRWEPLEAQPGAKDLRVNISKELNFEDFARQLAEAAGKTLDARWKLLDGVGAAGGVNLPVENTLENLKARDAIRIINEGLEPPSDGVDFRIDGDRLIFATTEYFDKQETVLVAYDLREQAAERVRQYENKSIAEATERVTEQVSMVIKELVHSEQWRDNGGDRANISVYGSKLFIRAPKRFHPEIEWVLSQLPKLEVPVLPDVPLRLEKKVQGVEMLPAEKILEAGRTPVKATEQPAAAR